MPPKFKIRFDSLSNGFTFKAIERKPRISNGSKRLTNSLIKGVCILDENGYHITVDVKEIKDKVFGKEEKIDDVITIDFTEESYNIKGVVSVFDRTPDKNGRYTRYIRNESYCKIHPGSPERYVPFCKNWICDGYLIKRNGVIMFDFHDCMYPKGYTDLDINREEDL